MNKILKLLLPPILIKLLKVFIPKKQESIEIVHPKTKRELAQDELNMLKGKYWSLGRYKEVKNLKFLNYTLSIPDFPSFYYQAKDIFLEESFKFIKKEDQKEEDLIIYDCGANIGAVSLYLHSLYPKAKIKVFEADPKIAVYLKENIKNNAINPKNIKIIEKAVWIDDNGITFHSEGADGGSVSNKIKEDTETVKIKTLRLKTLLEKEDRIDYLKIDIEGAEKEVLIDCKDQLSKVKYLSFEYHSKVGEIANLGEILHILENLNFKYLFNQHQFVSQVFINYKNKTWNEYDMLIDIYAINLNI